MDTRIAVPAVLHGRGRAQSAETARPRIAHGKHQTASVRWFLLPFLLLTCLSLETVVGDALRHPTFDFLRALFPRLESGCDLLGFAQRFHWYGTERFFGSYMPLFNYAAPLAVLTRLLFLVSPDPALWMRLLLVLWLALLGTMFASAVRGSRNATALVLCGAAVLLLGLPTLSLGFTCNLELLVWITTGTGLLCLASGQDRTAAACFGLAASMKYFPVMLLGVFLNRRQWRLVALGLAVCTASLLAGLLLLGPSLTVAFSGLQVEMAKFADHYLLHWQVTDNGYDHSIFGLIKLVLVATGHEAALPVALRLYMVAIAMAVPAVFALRVRHLRKTEQVMALSILCIWAVPMSQEYTLVHLLLPFACLVLDRSVHFANTRPNRLRLVCLAFLFAALPFLHIGPARLGGNVKAIALGVLLAATLRQRAGQRRPDDPAARIAYATANPCLGFLESAPAHPTLPKR